MFVDAYCSVRSSTDNHHPALSKANPATENKIFTSRTKRKMAPRSSFKQVYVDIPPSPYTSARKEAREQQQAQQVEHTPKPRFRPVPVVEIPRSPLWKHTPQRTNAREGSQVQKPITSLKMNTENARPAPLKEKNVQHSNAAQNVDKKSGKRKAGDLDGVNEAKKPRLDTAVRSPRLPQSPRIVLLTKRNNVVRPSLSNLNGSSDDHARRLSRQRM